MSERRTPVRLQSALINGGLVVAGLWGLATPNPLATLWSLALLAFILRSFWWVHFPGILLFCLLTPYIEIHTTVLEANNSGLTLDELYPGTGSPTFWMASIGLLIVTLGFQWGTRGVQSQLTFTLDELRLQAERISQTKLLAATFGANALSSVVNAIIPYGSSLRQLEFYITGISTALTMAFALHFWLTRKRPWLALGLFLFLLITSFYSYFSSWRTPLVLFLVSVMVTFKEFGWRQFARLTPILLPAMGLVLVWQTVKADYREFLSGGQRSQAVLVDRSTALNKFQELATEAVASEAILDDRIASDTYRRAGYLEYFSAAVGKVPAEIPHERGSLLRESLTFAFIPRILAPNKGVKNDRAKVEKYTDYYFGETSFSSFSLGHYCEAYIDWGPNLMMVHLLLYGLFGGPS